MASIYRRTKRKNEPYRIQYFDASGKRCSVIGFTDKGLTEQLALKLESEARQRRAGMIDLEAERLHEQQRAPINPHVAAFAESLTDNSPKHVALTMTRVRRVIKGCAFASLGDLAMEKVTTFMRSLRKKQGIGHRTFNHYLQAIDSFCNWCVKTKRLASNPLIGAERLNPETDVRRQRRALTAEEVGRLVESARSSKKRIQRFTGEERARIYILSYMTGLRRNEIGSLTPRSFNLDADPPTVTIEAVHSKHRRKDVLPLHPELATMVREWIADWRPTKELFPKLGRRRSWLMVKKDLERIGIPYRTADGVADFHAAGRHSHITELLRHGASLPEAQKLARHSDIKQTMKYAHIGIQDQARALASLPAPSAPPLDPGQVSDGQSSVVHPSLVQIRCTTGVFGCQDLATPDKTTGPINDATPCENKGFDIVCQPLAATAKMEAAGNWKTTTFKSVEGDLLAMTCEDSCEQSWSLKPSQDHTFLPPKIIHWESNPFGVLRCRLQPASCNISRDPVHFRPKPLKWTTAFTEVIGIRVSFNPVKSLTTTKSSPTSKTVCGWGSFESPSITVSKYRSPVSFALMACPAFSVANTPLIFGCTSC